VHVSDAVLRKRSTTPTWPRPAPPAPAVTEIWPETQAVDAAWAAALLDVVLVVVVVVVVVVEVAVAVLEVDGVGEDEPQPASMAIPTRQNSGRLTCRWRSSAAQGSPASG
jgi:hypothetical protein